MTDRANDDAPSPKSHSQADSGSEATDLLLTIETLIELQERIKSTDTIPAEPVPEIIASGQASGRSQQDFQRRAVAAQCLATIASDRPDLLVPYVGQLGELLNQLLSMELQPSERVFPEQYVEPHQEALQAGSELFANLATERPQAVTDQVDTLCRCSKSPQTDSDEATVALETIVEAHPQTVDPDPILELLRTDDPFVVVAGGRLVRHLIGREDGSRLLAKIDFQCFEHPLTNSDPDVSGGAARVLSDLVEAVTPRRILSEIDIQTLEEPLSYQDPYSCANATAVLCEFAADGYSELIARQIDLSLLARVLEYEDSNAIGNAAIVLGYVAECGGGYADRVIEACELPHLAQLLRHESSFVQQNVATLLGYLAEYDHADAVLGTINLGDLEPLVRASDPDSSGNAVALLNELIDGADATKVVAQFDLSVLSVALQHPDPFPRGNAVSTPGYLAEAGQANAVIEAISLQRLGELLTQNDERVCGGAAGSLADLAEAGHSETVSEVICIDDLLSLLNTSDPYVCGNAILAVGHLVCQEATGDLSTRVSISTLESLFARQDVDLRRHTALAVGAIAANGRTKRVLPLVPTLIKEAEATEEPVRLAAGIALAQILCAGASTIVPKMSESDPLGTVLEVATAIGTDRQVETDPADRTLWHLVSEACHAVVMTNRQYATAHTDVMQRLLVTVSQSRVELNIEPILVETLSRCRTRSSRTR